MAKKKILLLSDDLRMNSGVGTMSKEFVLGTLHHYDWVLMPYYIIQTQDFGDGYMKWNTRYDKRFLYFIITFGTIGQLLIITNFFMKVQI